MQPYQLQLLNRRRFNQTLGASALGTLFGCTLRADEPRAEVYGRRRRALTPAEVRQLIDLEKRLLTYFIDNQEPTGLIRDRQRNHGPLQERGITSSSATGMGLIALTLASHKEIGLLSRKEAEQRITRALERAIKLPEFNGMVAHFYGEDQEPLNTHDAIATIDSTWLIAGALWAASFFKSSPIDTLATKLHDRVNWRQWTDPEDKQRPDLLRHGMGADGKPLTVRWDRINNETAFMYLIATGSCGTKNVGRTVWNQLDPGWGHLEGERLGSADLGLFALTWSLELFDFAPYYFTDGLNLAREADIGARLNYRICRAQSGRFKTFKAYWCLSAGDGPPYEGKEAVYREYSPKLSDGTANLQAAVTALRTCPDEVFANLEAAAKDGRILGRYGLSSVNLDRGFVSPDVIGTDAGAAALAVHNVLFDEEVRTVFHNVPCIVAAREGMQSYCRR